MLGLSGGDPSFRDDDGSADPVVVTALAAFAEGVGSETAVLAALACARLLVPVVAVLAAELSQPEPAGPDDSGIGAEAPGAVVHPVGPAEPDAVTGPAAGPRSEAGGELVGDQAGGGEKASEMAMPTLIGLDGRRAIPAFTSLDSLRSWQPDARPVPAAALHVWQAALADSCAVVIDVAGPVPLAVEGARLAALARGEDPPAPCADPDVHEIVADVLAGQLDIASFALGAGDSDCDLVIALTLAPAGGGRDVAEVAAGVGYAVMARLGARLRRGVAVWLGPPASPGL